MNLPERYIERMKNLLGLSEYQNYEESLKQPYHVGLRANDLKIDVRKLSERLIFAQEPIPWTSNGLYYDKAFQPAKHPYYHAGLFYIQEPSAMLPAEMLPVVPGDCVLDLCAAPGGKSTQLGAKLGGHGLLVSNDVSVSRAKGLVKNIELFGIRNAIVTGENPEKLSQYFSSFFDKILVDAPCSGEGMFRKEPGMAKNWEAQDYNYYAGIQREILSYAVEMLKPGGVLVYSTCTFSPEENEAQIAGLLAGYPDLSLDELTHEHGIRPGVAGLDAVMRLWPQCLKGEGHFVARLRKSHLDFTSDERAIKQTQPNMPSETLLKPYCEFESELLTEHLDRSRMMLLEERLFYLPEGLPDLKGLRILKSGWYLGDLLKGRFEPSQHFAMGLDGEKVRKTINLAAEDPNTIKYLKGETLDIAVTAGYHLVCVDGYPLGWAKGAGMKLKNKYCSTWRYQ